MQRVNKELPSYYDVEIVEAISLPTNDHLCHLLITFDKQFESRSGTIKYWS